MLANRGVSQVTEMVHISFRANIGIFHFSKIAHTYITRQVRARATMAERTHRDAFLQNGSFQCGIAHHAPVANFGIVYGSAWSNTTERAEARLAGNHGAGENHAVRADFNLRVNVSGSRVDNRD